MRDAPQADIHSFGLVIAAPYDGEVLAHLIASRNSDSEGKGGGRERGTYACTEDELCERDIALVFEDVHGFECAVAAVAEHEAQEVACVGERGASELDG